MIFDGKKFAQDLIAKLPKRKAKLAIFLDPENVSGAKYVQKKVELAKRLGVEMVMNKIDGSEDGIMVQLPHPNAKELISQIPLEKDVDGLRDGSPFKPAVVRAVLAILAEAKRMGSDPIRLVIVGNRGFAGSRLQRELGCDGMDKDNFDPSTLLGADAIISCTGQAGLLKPEMVKNGFVAIDVGYPEAEFTPEALSKASWHTPVPGGVGPVTVVMLFANLLKSEHEI